VAVSADPPATAAMPYTAPTSLSAYAEAAPGPAETRSPAVGSGTVAVGNEIAAPPVLPGVVDLTLQQYASLRAELHMRPAHTAAVLERYRVSAEGREALDAYWRLRFEADPLLRMMFARNYAEYIAWLKANPIP